MPFYRDHILPRLIHLAMQREEFAPYRERAVATATGRILEVGIGSGANLPFYGAGAHEIVGLEPSSRLAAMARQAAIHTPLPLTVIEASAEAIPLDDRSIDTVVMTWTLCSIPAAIPALREMLRVLKPGGRLLFVEHGLGPDPRIRKWQHRLTPCWKHLAGGCHLDRAINTLVQDAGFRIEKLDTGYMRGPRPLTFLYEGVAVAG